MNPNTQAPKKIIATVIANDQQVIKDFWYFARLANKYLSQVGSKAYMETTENGFVMFLNSLEDLEKAHQRPQEDNERFRNMHRFLKKQQNKGLKTLKPFHWSISFTQKPREINDEKIRDVVRNYWTFFYATVSYLKNTKSGPQILVNFVDGDLYKMAMNYQINRIKAFLENKTLKHEKLMK